MLALDIQRNGRNLSVELPMNTNLLVGELRAIGINEPLDKINRHDFLLQPTNELGEHFMRLVRPDDTLHAIAIASREFDVLAAELRQALVDLIKADRLRNLEHMTDYLQYGPDTLEGLMRLDYNGQSIVLPASQTIMYERFGAETPMGLIRLAEAGLKPVSEIGRQLMAEFQTYSDTIATANVACELALVPNLRTPMASVVAAARNIQPPMPTEDLDFYFPLSLRAESGEGILTEKDPGELVYHAEEIADGLNEYGDMVGFLPRELEPKIASIKWDTAKIGPTLYGCVCCEQKIPLTAEEKTELAEWVAEQNAGGELSDFDQIPIETDMGDLYVSLWHSGEDYYVLPEDEFRAQVLEPQVLDDQGFGGMEGMC